MVVQNSQLLKYNINQKKNQIYIKPKNQIIKINSNQTIVEIIKLTQEVKLILVLGKKNLLSNQSSLHHVKTIN